MGNETNMYQGLHRDQSCHADTMYGGPCAEPLDIQAPQQEWRNDMGLAEAATTPIEAIRSISLHDEDISPNGAESVLSPSSSALLSVEPAVASNTSEAATYTDVVEQMLCSLNEAALRIAAFERSTRRHLRPSRLSRYRDISSEIQRQNTPLPSTGKSTDDLSKQLIAIWPWLEEEEDTERDRGSQQIDPLALRHWPALLSRLSGGQEQASRVTGPITLPQPSRHFIWARVAMLGLILLTLCGLIVDGTLITLILKRHQAISATTLVTGGAPTLTLAANKATLGQVVQVHILHFSASSSVLLTRDTDIQIRTSTGTGLIRLDRTGAAEVTFPVDHAWSPGLHTLEAEDMRTHYTAFASLQVLSSSTAATHFAISSTFLNFGADMQGTNTIQMLMLYNNGSGSISWSAYSNQPWLRIAPAQGSYSDAQTVIIGCQRSNLQPGNYNATITVSTNTGDFQQVQVTMAVQALRSHQMAVLSVTPAVVSLTARARSSDVDTTYLLLSNPGSQALSWSLADNLPVTIANSGSAASINWLTVDQTSGTVAPGMTSLIGVYADSLQLLPGLYINDLLFNVSSGHRMQDTPQHVEIVLAVQ